MKLLTGTLFFSIALINMCSAITIEVSNVTCLQLVITDPQLIEPSIKVAPAQHVTINYPDQIQEPAITIATMLPEKIEPLVVYQLPHVRIAPEKNYRLWITEAINTAYFQLDITFQGENETILKATRYCNKPHDFSNDHRVY